MTTREKMEGLGDHCRIGSLEILYSSGSLSISDHCRIGSLEIGRAFSVPAARDHCRIGSLERSKT